MAEDQERVPTEAEMAEMEKAAAIAGMSSTEYDFNRDPKGYNMQSAEVETPTEPVESVEPEQPVSEDNTVEGETIQNVTVTGHMDAFFEKLDRMSPQEVYDQYVQGENGVSLEDYYGSLEKGSVKDFAQQAPNIKGIYDGLEETLNNPEATSGEKELAEIRMKQLSSIYNAKVEQWDKHKEATAKTAEQQTQTVGVMRLPEDMEKENPYQFKAAQPYQPEVLKTEPKEEIVTPYAPGQAPAKDDTQTVEQPAPVVEKSAPIVEKAAPQNDNTYQTNPDIDSMISKIDYMNKRNHAAEGSDKYVDPQETAQKMYALYGENASNLLHEAIMAPNEVNGHANGAITDRAQTYSREAVSYLANLSPEQAKEYANRALSPAELAKGNEHEQVAAPQQKQSRQEALKENLTDIKEKNPAQFADLQSAIQEIANGAEFDQVFAKLIIKMLNGAENVDTSASIEQMLTNAGYENTKEGKADFVEDAQAAFNDIAAKQQDGKTRAGMEQAGIAASLTRVDDAAKIKGIKIDEYGYIVGSEEAKKHDKDMKEYRELYKDPKKFKKAKESYENALKGGNLTEQAKYYLKVIDTVEKEEKLKEQMQKDSEKASKHIEKLNKKIEKLEKKIDKNKDNKEKVDELTAELKKLQEEKAKEQKKVLSKDGKEAKGKEGEGKDGKKADGKEAAGTSAGKDGNETPTAATVQKTTTGNNVIYKIVQDGKERSVNVSNSNGNIEMSFYSDGKPMTVAERQTFMKDLKEHAQTTEGDQIDKLNMAIKSGKVKVPTDKQASRNSGQTRQLDPNTNANTQAAVVAAKDMGLGGR